MMALDPGPLVRVLFRSFSDESLGSDGKSVGRVCGVGSGVFVLKVIESIGDVGMLVVLLPKGVESKGGRLVELFCNSKS